MTEGDEGRRFHYLVYLFLIGLAGPAADVFSGDARPAWLSVATLAAFVACFVIEVGVEHNEAASWVREDARSRVRWRRGVTLVVVMGVIAAASTVGWGSSWLVLFVYVVATAAFLAPARLAPVVIAGVAGTAVLSEIAGGWDVVTGTTALSWALSIIMAGFIAALMRRRNRLIAELRATQEEVARLAAADAVADERLRFSRDLHDLLGHSLSLIVLKAELARRLLERGDAGEQAHTEVAELEDAARRALVEVREAVAGYRARSLTAEVERGRSALAAAGVEVTVDEVPDFPPAVDELLAWVVREATTNIVRHSSARHVHVAIADGAHEASLEVTDDGTGPAEWDWLAAARSGGSGLLGLQERVAAAGGRFTAGPAAGGGFRVGAFVPLEGSAAGAAST